jgi:hypothetical protein
VGTAHLGSGRLAASHSQELQTACQSDLPAPAPPPHETKNCRARANRPARRTANRTTKNCRRRAKRPAPTRRPPTAKPKIAATVPPSTDPLGLCYLETASRLKPKISTAVPKPTSRIGRFATTQAGIRGTVGEECGRCDTDYRFIGYRVSGGICRGTRRSRRGSLRYHPSCSSTSTAVWSDGTQPTLPMMTSKGWPVSAVFPF